MALRLSGGSATQQLAKVGSWKYDMLNRVEPWISDVPTLLLLLHKYPHQGFGAPGPMKEA